MNRTGGNISEIIPMPLEDIKDLSANTYIRLNQHSYILNIVEFELQGQHVYELILTSVQHAVRADLSARLSQTKDKFPALYIFDNIVAEDPASRRAVETAKAFSVFDETILITGPTGTGKELFASSIHNASPRSKYPFVAINCGTLSESLIDSELFGYEKGSFTGALSSGKRGLFEMAHRGTIFLDEISEIPLDLQTKLLRVLQEKTIRRIGGSEVIPVDVRVIAATNKPLLQQCEKGLFRYDLYYRLALLEINLPSLNERPGDIIPLFTYFLEKSMAATGRKHYWEDNSVFSVLTQCRWTGNIRELENTALRTIILAPHHELQEEDILRALPATMNRQITASPEKTVLPAAPDSSPENTSDKFPEIFTSELTGDLNELEHRYLTYLMERMDGDRDAICSFLNISKPTLWRKLNYKGQE